MNVIFQRGLGERRCILLCPIYPITELPQHCGTESSPHPRKQVLLFDREMRFQLDVQGTGSLVEAWTIGCQGPHLGEKFVDLLVFIGTSPCHLVAE